MQKNHSSSNGYAPLICAGVAGVLKEASLPWPIYLGGWLVCITLAEKTIPYALAQDTQDISIAGQSSLEVE